tara:strand:- start:244 stop:543 length:300 start_codon:yes stop_codon:yes gene_type:complete
LDKILLQKNIINQLNKDLQLSGFKPILDFDKDLNSNLNIMISFLTKNISHNLSNLYPFLYRLDLEESHIKNVLELDIEQFVYLVFNRAKKKVVFKTNFN